MLLNLHDAQASDFIHSCGVETRQVAKASLSTFLTEQNVYTQVGTAEGIGIESLVLLTRMAGGVVCAESEDIQCS